MLRDDHPPGALGVGSITTEDPHGLLGEPAQKLTAVGDLSLRLGQWLAHLEGHQQATSSCALAYQVEGPTQDLGALPRWRLGPGRRSIDRCIQRGGTILDAGVGDGLDHFAGRRDHAHPMCAPEMAGRHSPPMNSPSGTDSSNAFSDASDIDNLPGSTVTLVHSSLTLRSRRSASGLPRRHTPRTQCGTGELGSPYGLRLESRPDPIGHHHDLRRDVCPGRWPRSRSTSARASRIPTGRPSCSRRRGWPSPAASTSTRRARDPAAAASHRRAQQPDITG